MSQTLIDRYRKSYRLQFQTVETEVRYRDILESGVRHSSAYAFAVLFLLCLAYAYLEYRAFGREIPIPMYGYLLAAVLALANMLFNWFSTEPPYQIIRLIGNGVLALGTVIGAVYLQKYSAYHAIEFILLAIWFGSLKAVRAVFTITINLLLAILFVGAMYATGISSFWIMLVSIVLVAALVLAGYIAYLTERGQRLLFLETDLNRRMIDRQELWAFTLIDLEVALTGIQDFKELIGQLKQHLEPVIEFESYILTSLEGQGPRPVADKIEGELFENDDRTLWSEDLLGKLTQTRQATTSAEHEKVGSFLGMERKKFTSYRLDVPVFDESKLLGACHGYGTRRRDPAEENCRSGSDFDYHPDIFVGEQGYGSYGSQFRRIRSDPGAQGCDQSFQERGGDRQAHDHPDEPGERRQDRSRPLSHRRGRR